MSDFTAATFDEAFPAMIAYRAGTPIAEVSDCEDESKPELALLIDGRSLGVWIPSWLIQGVITAVETLKKSDPANGTDKLPVFFVLHNLLRMRHDFGIVQLRSDSNGTFAWKNRFLPGLTPKVKVQIRLRRRLAGLLDYAAKHGIISTYALTDEEEDKLTGATTMDMVSALWD